MTKPNRGGGFVFLALVLTLVLATILGINVLTTARYHRSLAEGVLGDYADFAAAEFANRIQTALAPRLFPLLNRLAGQRKLLDPAELQAATDSAVWRVVGDELSLFRIGPATGLEVSGRPLPESVRAVLADTVPKLGRSVFSRQAYLSLLFLSTEPTGAVAAIAPASSEVTTEPVTVGLVFGSEVLKTFIAVALDRAPLLPPSLTDGVDSVVRFRVTGPTGHRVIESAVAPGPRFRAARTLEPMWGGLRLEVAIEESAAGRLVIGGLPGSRLPLVLALLGLTTLLVATAWHQLRRERDLARQREAFVAGVSHELRTPLAQIRLFAETLRLGRVRSEAEGARSLEVIDREARRLGQLVENLLTATRGGRRGLAVVTRDVDLTHELQQAVEAFSPIGAARGTVVSVAAPERLTAVADGHAFRQIVINLLDNAVKYGPPGQTVVVVLDKEDGMARLTVDDQGPGIAVADRSRVFERFVRLAPMGDTEVPGTGLGLALVRELVGQHGGRVVIDSGSRGGARVVVQLPLQTRTG
jgi:signal transduction histidine kinase